MIIQSTLPPSNITVKLKEEQNLAIKTWTKSVVRDIKNSALTLRKGKNETSRTRPSPNGPLLRVYRLSIKSYTEYKLANSIGYKLYQKNDIVEGAGIRIQRHGVFVQKGVGRGYQMRNGRVVRVDGRGLNVRKSDRPLSSKPFRRYPTDWFNTTIERRTDELADTIVRINENAVVNTLRLRIV